MSGVVQKRGIDIATLRQRLQAASGGELRRAMSDALGATGQRLTLDGFRGSRAPDGTPWAAVKRSGKPLIDTGNLRQSVVMQSNEAGFRIEVAAPYAKYQQEGTRGHRGALGARRRRLGLKRLASGITPRPMVPRDARDLDPVWMPALKQTALQVARVRLGT